MTTSSTKLVWGLLIIIAMMITVIIPFERPAEACGNEPFVGEVCLFAFNFCPQGYMAANGQLLSINEYQVLYELLGTTYGGDCKTTFALPDLRGRTPVDVGQGVGLSTIDLGQEGGAEQVTLNVSQLPSHSHSATTAVKVTATLMGTNSVADESAPGGNVLATTQNANDDVYSIASADVAMGKSSIKTAATASTKVGSTGGNQPIDIRSPFLGMTYCIAFQGIFPSRN